MTFRYYTAVDTDKKYCIVIYMLLQRAWIYRCNLKILQTFDAILRRDISVESLHAPAKRILHSRWY